MTRALLIIDVQNDFTEGGALGVDGGNAVASGITHYLAQHPGRYADVFASRDWHNPTGDNGGHFATDSEPDYVTTWPVHCVAGTAGAEYHPELDTTAVTAHVLKGQGRPAYSIFEGTVDGTEFSELLRQRGVTDVDVVGIATDYCVLASARDALAEGLAVTVLSDLVAGVAAESSDAAFEELAAAGAGIRPSE